MVDAGSIWVRLGLDSSQLVTGLNNAKTGLVSWRDETNKGSKDMLAWGASITATAAPLVAMGYALAEVTNKAAAFGKSIKDNARDLGLSTEQYQRWTHAAIASGSTAEEMSGSIRMLTIRLKEASDPASEASRYLKAMGVSAYDSNGKLRDTDAVLKDILPALNALPEGMERNQASMVLFGKSFSNIADLTSLTRDELQKLMDQAPVFSDEKIQKMDDYAIQTALLNEKIQNLTVDIGTEFIPVMEDMLSILEDMEPAISAIGDSFHVVATGMHWDIQGLQLLYTQWRYGMDSPEMKALQADVQADYEKEMRWRSGYTDMTSYGAADAKRRFRNASSLVLPEVEKEATAATTRSSASSSAAWSASSVVGSAGSEMQLFMQREMELGTDYQGALDKWAKGEQTRGSPMSGTLGAVGKSTGTKTTSKPGTAAETASVKSELKDQSAAFTELNTTVKSGWSELEQTGIIHWKAMGDMAKTTYQYIMDAAAQTVNFAGSNPVIQKIVTLSKDGYSIDPSPLPTITAPRLADIDFSGVQFSGGAGAAGTQAGGGGTTVNVEQNVTVVSPQGTPAQNAAALRKANQGLGSLVSSGVY